MSLIVASRFVARVYRARFSYFSSASILTVPFDPFDRPFRPLSTILTVPLASKRAIFTMGTELCVTRLRKRLRCYGLSRPFFEFSSASILSVPFDPLDLLSIFSRCCFATMLRLVFIDLVPSLDPEGS